MNEDSNYDSNDLHQEFELVKFDASVDSLTTEQLREALKSSYRHFISYRKATNEYIGKLLKVL